jgi:hypothetical protein
MPFTGFWARWRRRHLQHSPRAPNLRETERQREAAERQAAEQMAKIMTASSGGVAGHHHSDGGRQSEVADLTDAPGRGCAC